LEDKGGNKQPSWESLDLVKQGDVVFHFAKKMVRGISLVTSESRIAEIRIRDRGQWQDLGREIEVEAQDFDFTIDLDEIPLEFRIGSESGIDTPFDKNGKVKQGYLFKLPQQGAQFLLTRLNLVNSEDERSLDNQVKELLGDFSSGTDKPITGTFRREQRALRQHLIGNRKSGECGVCGRSLSSNLLACVLGCDSLFDKGFIYIDQSGIIKVSSKSDGYPDLSQFVSAIDGQVAKAFSTNAKDYFAWHETNIALKTQQ
jgi:hypothetical protein